MSDRVLRRQALQIRKEFEPHLVKYAKQLSKGKKATRGSGKSTPDDILEEVLLAEELGAPWKTLGGMGLHNALARGQSSGIFG